MGFWSGGEVALNSDAGFQACRPTSHLWLPFCGYSQFCGLQILLDT